MVSASQPLIHSSALPHSDFWRNSRHRLSLFLSTRLPIGTKAGSPMIQSHFGSSTRDIDYQKIRKHLTDLADNFYYLCVDRSAAHDGNRDGIVAGRHVRGYTGRKDDGDKISLATLFAPGGLIDSITPQTQNIDSVFQIPQSWKKAIQAQWNSLFHPAAPTPQGPQNQIYM